MNNIYKWLNPEKSRFYTIELEASNYNFVLKHFWGGCNNNRRFKKELLINTFDEVQKYIQKMTKKRKNRGYFLI